MVFAFCKIVLQESIKRWDGALVYLQDDVALPHTSLVLFALVEDQAYRSLPAKRNKSHAELFVANGNGVSTRQKRVVWKQCNGFLPRIDDHAAIV